MRSLRSLCLLKVHSRQDMLDMTELPPNLVKDLKIMQLVNASFESLCLDYVNITRDHVAQTTLSIEYDGAFWNFRSCTTNCSHWDFKQPELKQFTLEEGKPAPTKSPFWEASYLLEQLDQMASVNLRMIMSFEMNEEGTWGKISFRGTEDFATVPVVFSSDIVVEMGTRWKRKLNCDGFLGRGRDLKFFAA